MVQRTLPDPAPEDRKRALDLSRDGLRERVKAIALYSVFGPDLTRTWDDVREDIVKLAEEVRDAAMASQREKDATIAEAARDLDGPHEGKQLDCGCDLMIVQHLRAWNESCEHVAAAIRAQKGKP